MASSTNIFSFHSRAYDTATRNRTGGFIAKSAGFLAQGDPRLSPAAPGSPWDRCSAPKNWRRKAQPVRVPEHSPAGNRGPQHAPPGRGAPRKKKRPRVGVAGVLGRIGEQTKPGTGGTTSSEESPQAGKHKKAARSRGLRTGAAINLPQALPPASARLQQAPAAEQPLPRSRRAVR